MTNTKIEKAVEEFIEKYGKYIVVAYPNFSEGLLKYFKKDVKESFLTSYQQGKKDRDKEIVKILDWRNKDDDVQFFDGDDVVEWIDAKLKTLSNQNNEK